MGLNLGTLFVNVKAKTDDAKKDINDLSKKLKDISGGLSKTGKSLTVGLTTPILGAAIASIKLASDLNESINKVDVAFGDSAKTVESWSTTTLDKFGIAQGDALDMAATFGDMATSMGLPTNKAADMSEKMVGLAGDLASFKNISIDESNTALTAVFTGETESLKRLGIVMTDTNLSNFALSEGIKKPIDKMTEAEKVQLRYQFVLAKTKNAQGDFANTADGTANSMRVGQESVKELGESFGTNLLPLITPIIQNFTKLVKQLGSLDNGTKQTITTILGIVAVIGPALLIAGKVTGVISAIVKAHELLKTATMAQTIAQTGLNATLLANPITWIVVGIAALITTLVLLYQHNVTFRNFVNSFLNGAKALFTTVINAIVGFFTSTIPNAFKSLQTNITNIGNSIGQFFTNTWNSIVAFFTQGIPAFISSVGQWFLQLPYNIGFALGEGIKNVIQFGQNLINFVTTVIPQFINNIITWFQQLPGRMWNALLTAISRIQQFGSNALSYLSSAIPHIISSVGNWFSQLPGKVWNSLSNVLGHISNWGSQMISKAGQAANNTVKSITSFFSNLPSNMLNIGKNIITGLWNGISGAGNWIKDKVGGFCNNIIGGFKAGFGIHSPSVLMKNLIGKNLALGLGQGFTENMESVSNQMLDSIPFMNGNIASTALNASYEVSNKTQQAQQSIAQPTSGNLEAHINIDGREFAIVTAPYMAKELAA